jgi:hypothetical protein
MKMLNIINKFALYIYFLIQNPLNFISNSKIIKNNNNQESGHIV